MLPVSVMLPLVDVMLRVPELFQNKIPQLPLPELLAAVPVPPVPVMLIAPLTVDMVRALSTTKPRFWEVVPAVEPVPARSILPVPVT